jgi:hypothetical protein
VHINRPRQISARDFAPARQENGLNRGHAMKLILITLVVVIMELMVGLSSAGILATVEA